MENRPPEILDALAPLCTHEAFRKRLAIAAEWLRSGKEALADEVRQKLGNGIAASESCVTAIYLALRFVNASFEEMQAFATRCGGDVDTIGAMAGALWGASNGSAKLPTRSLEQLEQRARLTALAAALHDRAKNNSPIFLLLNVTTLHDLSAPVLTSSPSCGTL